MWLTPRFCGDYPWHQGMIELALLVIEQAAPRAALPPLGHGPLIQHRHPIFMV